MIGTGPGADLIIISTNQNTFTFTTCLNDLTFIKLGFSGLSAIYLMPMTPYKKGSLIETNISKSNVGQNEKVNFIKK